MKTENKISKIKPSDSDYPKLLKEISGRPDPLYFLGILPPENYTAVSVVGTRKATSQGKILAKKIAYDLAKKGFVIASGLALGIDGAAHEGALAAKGVTIAVLANGLDAIYPRTHERLAENLIKEGGVIFSEYPAGTPALPHQFLERNRIVSGLSIATIVIEAPRRSGALVTARNAIEQGREVFVLPGPADHPNYQGSHLLIRNGARLVSNAEEIMEDLSAALSDIGSPIKEKLSKRKVIDDPNQEIIVKVLEKAAEPLNVDNIAEATKLEPYIINQSLTFLMFDGLIEEKNGKFKLK